MPRYLVSYLDVDLPRMSHGSVEVTVPAPISSMGDVEQLTESIRCRFNFTSPVIMGFSRFDEEGR